MIGGKRNAIEEHVPNPLLERLAKKARCHCGLLAPCLDHVVQVGEFS
jgi:hypothetical protein